MKYWCECAQSTKNSQIQFIVSSNYWCYIEYLLNHANFILIGNPQQGENEANINEDEAAQDRHPQQVDLGVNEANINEDEAAQDHHPENGDVVENQMVIENLGKF